MAEKYHYLTRGEAVNFSTDSVCCDGKWKRMSELGETMWRDGEPWNPMFNKVRRPLKPDVADRSASTNIGYAAALWKELRRRNGGKFPAKQDWVAVTKERLNSALKAAQHCA